MSESSTLDEVRVGQDRLRGRIPHRHHPSRQFVRFVLVGVVNTAINVGVYRLLLETGTPYLIAAPVGFGAGAVNSYVFNRRWTFAARDSTKARVLFLVVQLLGAGATALLVLLFVRAAGTDKVIAQLAAIPPVTVAMFVANRWWTFAERHPTHD